MYNPTRSLFLITALAAVFFLGKTVEAAPLQLRLVSLNLHGYHPKDEAERFWENFETGEMKQTSPQLHFFERDELERGHEKQLLQIQTDFSELAPDLIFLQEVGAGLPESAKDCGEFYDDLRPDKFGKNTALKIKNLLNARAASPSAYSAFVGCRGNIGWQTHADTFSKGRVLKKDTRGSSVVFDKGASPYPNGFIVEGTAILAKAPWHFVDQQSLRLPFGTGTEKFFFQLATLKYGNDPRWILVANLHAGWDVSHLEQAVAVRSYIADYVSYNSDRTHFAGAIIAGDFNSRLFRPGQKDSEIGSLPWEVRSNVGFDFSKASDLEFEKLKAQYTKSLPKENPQRIAVAVDSFKSFARSEKEKRVQFREVIEQASMSGLCQMKNWAPKLEPSCSRNERIDLAFVSSGIDLKSASLLWTKDDFKSTHGPSDHPGFIVDLSIY